MPESIPVPPFSRRLPKDVADRIRATAASKAGHRRRVTVLVSAAVQNSC